MANLSNDEMMERLGLCFVNYCLGRVLVKEYNEKHFNPAKWEEIDDEKFTVLAFDLNISDKLIAEIFKTTPYQVQKRRQALKIKKGRWQMTEWVNSDRQPVNLDVFIADVSAYKN